MLIYFQEKQEERDKWLSISNSIVPNYQLAFNNYFYQYFEDRPEMLINKTQGLPLSSNHEETIFLFYNHLRHKKLTDDARDKFSAVYLRYFHGLAKSLESRVAKGSASFGAYTNLVHTHHYHIAKYLNNFFHIRKIHELYGDIFILPNQDQGRIIPFSYAVSSQSNLLVKELRDKFVTLRAQKLSANKLRLWQSLRKDALSIKETISIKQADPYFDYILKNCDVAISFIKGELTKLKIDPNFSLFMRRHTPKYYAIDEDTAIVKSSMQYKQYLETYLNFEGPIEVNCHIKMLSNHPRAMAGVGTGDLTRNKHDGRMVLVQGRRKYGWGRPATHHGEFRDFKSTILIADIKHPGDKDFHIKAKFWEGAVEIYIDGRLIETYLDEGYKIGSLFLGTPPWYSLGGNYQYSHINIRKINDPKPTKGYKVKYKLYKEKK
ncbi:MAG: hypothetical protein NE334_04385 [Lentisphaeraceae bacterium]|nr:hypothetical protein [Lentisphaeraceae bacterium]